MELLDSGWSFLKEKHSFWDIEDSNFLVKIKWSKEPEKDYSELADNYFKCAYKICNEVVQSGHDNIKSDMWFLPSVYMFRQSIELGIKALICRTISSNKRIQEIFCKFKHDLSSLFELYKKSEENYLEHFELSWLEDYLDNLEEVDKKSDLFRFPFNDEFLKRYRNQFLDVCSMGNNLWQSYSLVKKCLDKGNKSSIIEFDKNRAPKFLKFATDGIGNCYLWESITSDGFHKQVVGYSEAAQFLFCKCDNISNEQKTYPLVFLYRNLIELSLKRMFYKNVEHGVLKYNKIRSHILYKDLWKNVKPMIEYYAGEREDVSLIDVVGKQLEDLSGIDKEGDMFRYPTSFSLEYKFNKEIVDLKNICKYMQTIFNFLDGCDCQLSEISDYELERKHYNDY